MYKERGDIVKIFSKQPFELHKIMDEEYNLLPLQELKKYARSVFNKVVRGVSEYQEIIYGLNRKYLDFKIADIKDVPTFLNLYNQLFNIDKAIIDSKSIKKAIQTSLNLEQKFQEFNASEYLEKIKQFEANYRFFREFERRKQDITKAYTLKQKLLHLESELLQLQRYCNYRQEYEKHLAEEIQTQIATLQKSIEKVGKQLECYQKAEKRVERRYAQRELQLRQEIAAIKELQKRFSPQAISQAKEAVARKNTIERRLQYLNEDISKLRGAFEDVRKNIEEEIDRLKRERDILLPLQKEEKERLQKDSLEREFREFWERIELESEKKISLLEAQREELQSQIEAYQKSIDELMQQKGELALAKERELERLHQHEEQLREKKRKKREELDSFLQKSFEEEREILQQLQKAERSIKNSKRKRLQIYKETRRTISTSLQELQALALTKRNSFKEFLQERVEGWEESLYPLLDSTLLDLDIAILKPKITRLPLLGLEYDSTSLKKLPSYDELQEHIRKKKSELQAQKEAFYQAIVALNEELVQERVAWEMRLQRVHKERKLKEEEVANSLEELEGEIAKIFEQKELLRSNYAEQRELLELQKEEYRQNIADLQKQIKEIHHTIAQILFRAKARMQKKRAEKERRLKQITKELARWLQEEQQKIDAKIEQKREEIITLTKDERLQQLEREKRGVEEELKKIIASESFLEEFARKKEQMSKGAHYQRLFVQTLHKKERVLRRFLNKIHNLSTQKEGLAQQQKEQQQILEKIKQAQEALKEGYERLCDEQEATQSYLIELLERFVRLRNRYESMKVDLKNILFLIAKSLKGFYQVNGEFKSEEFEAKFISQMEDTLYKIDELYEFQQKQFEINKEGENKYFRNFTLSLLKHKLAQFKKSEDDFFSQVVKINKNLAQIDFGVIKRIRLEARSEDKRSIAYLLQKLNSQLDELQTFFQGNSLFYDAREAQRVLYNLQAIFIDIKKSLKGDAISLVDTLDLSLSFEEGGVLKQNITQIKNESSTGGSILLKMAIAISILKLFMQRQSDFFLIVDEVSRLHSLNQEKLRTYANKNGFKIIFVTPEPTFANPKTIRYYKFIKEEEHFSLVELNRL